MSLTVSISWLTCSVGLLTSIVLFVRSISVTVAGHCGFFVSEVAVSSGAVVSAVVGATVVSDALLKAEAVSVAWGAVEVSVLF